MRRIFRCFFALSCAVFYPGYASAQQNLENSNKALKYILDFSNGMCASIPLGGEADKIELNMDGKAQLGALINKLADLKIQGSAEIPERFLRQRTAGTTSGHAEAIYRM
jgi:hypothetical protein